MTDPVTTPERSDSRNTTKSAISGRGEFGGQRLGRLAPPPGHRDQGALAGRRPGDGRAEALRAAADQHHPVLKKRHLTSLGGGGHTLEAAT
jgi:hypothetical protein